jgi:hypothetical protein
MWTSVGEQLIWLHNTATDVKTEWDSSWCDKAADAMELLHVKQCERGKSLAPIHFITLLDFHPWTLSWLYAFLIHLFRQDHRICFIKYTLNPILHMAIRTCLKAWFGSYAIQHFLLFFKNILAFEPYKKVKDNVTIPKVCIIFLYSCK